MHPDPWFNLRRHTSARIALGRSGGSLPTEEVLSFAMAHAAARDAVWSILDPFALAQDMKSLGLPTLFVRSAAPDRATYLRRPDLGRRLDKESAATLVSLEAGPGCDVCLIIADGLSALAAQLQAPAVLAALIPLLRAGELTIGPIVIASLARVAIQDSIGAAMHAKIAVILIGERPGLGTADSLGAYLVHAPRPGRNDAERNCVSNIRPAGLTPALAAEALHYLIAQAIQKKISGVALKDDRTLSVAPRREIDRR